MKPRHDAILSDLMTTNEVAQYLQVQPSTLYKLIRRGQFRLSRSAPTTVLRGQQSKSGLPTYR